MACVFPTFVTSEYTIDEEFLVPLKMERYASVFHGLSVDELRELTDERLQSMGVMIKGHRSRLLKGVAAVVNNELARDKALANERHFREERREDLRRTIEEEIVRVEEVASLERLQNERHGYSRADPQKDEVEDAAPDEQDAVDESSSSGIMASDDERREQGREDTERSIDAYVLRHLTRRVAVTVALVVVLLLLAYTLTEGAKMQALASIASVIAAQVTLTAVMASFWPTDAALRTGWGRACVTLVYGATMVKFAYMLRTTWPLASLYPIPGQAFLHKAGYSIMILVYVHAFIQSACGLNSWARVRALFEVQGTMSLAMPVGLHVLEGDGILRTPTHTCYLLLCLSNDSLIEAWVGYGVLALGSWTNSILGRSENRKVIARCTGLAHVPLPLGAIRVPYSRSRRLQQVVEGGCVRRDVTSYQGMPLVVMARDDVEDAEPVCRQQ